MIRAGRQDVLDALPASGAVGGGAVGGEVGGAVEGGPEDFLKGE
ncbi:hypothetical protein ACFVZ3_40730 [Kitasatospora purpeofusca]